MLPWLELQNRFAQALRDPQRATPAGLVGPDGRPDAKRFGVYRNNVFSGLIDCLAERYPAVYRLLGAECFRETARRFVERNLPRSPVLIEYGAELPDFLERFEPLAQLPYLADVARIERAWLQAYHAPEAQALDPDALAAIPAHRAADLCFTLHPSVRLVRSRFPALSIWHLNVADSLDQPVRLVAGGEDALLARPEAEVRVSALGRGAADFLAALAAGRALGQAAERARSAHEAFDLTEHLTALLEGGLVIAGRLKRRRTRGH